MKLDGPNRAFEKSVVDALPKEHPTEGKIIAVCVSHTDGIPKSRLLLGGMLERHGLRDDYHNNAMRRSFSNPGTFKPNVDRHISVIAFEVLKDLSEELKIPLDPGSLGDNLTVEGLGDLSQIKDGSILNIGEKIRLRVIEQNQPCVNLAPLHRLLPKKIHGRRGLMCAVEVGIGEWITPDQKIRVIKPRCTG